jgi:DASH complex subunit ASK1
LPDFDTPEATPRPTGQKTSQIKSSYVPQFEKSRRHPGDNGPQSPSSTLPSTPRGQTMSEGLLDEDDEEEIEDPTFTLQSERQRRYKQGSRDPVHDPLIHMMLDKNYRIEATPHKNAPRLPPRYPDQNARTRTPGTGRRAPPRGRNALDDLDSSPMMEAPQLNAAIFNSPVRAPRVPGVSVLTPAKPKPRDMPHEELEENASISTRSHKTHVWDSDSDDDGLPEGMSPPKTMQFHIPQSKLLKTPGMCHELIFVIFDLTKQQLRRLVKGLLMTFY